MGKGRLAGRVKDPTQLTSGNPGMFRRAGYLFRHVVIGAGKHMARYVEVDGVFRCSVCQAEV